MIIYKKTVRKNGIDYWKSGILNEFINTFFVAFMLLFGFIGMVETLVVNSNNVFALLWIPIYVVLWIFGYVAIKDQGKLEALKQHQTKSKGLRKRRSK